MHAMLPVIARGRTERCLEALPDEEFLARIDRLQRAMADRGLAWSLVVGDRRDHGALCYVSGLVPRESIAAALVPVAGTPELFVGVPSARDLPALRETTWLEDVQLLDVLWERLLSGSQPMRGPIAFALPARVPSGIHRRVAGAPGAVPAADLLAAAMNELRPRERALLRTVVSLTSRAVEAAAEAHGCGACPREAMIEAELDARRNGAHEVRVLIGDARATLMPAADSTREQRAMFVYYLAVECLGYWAERWGTVGADPVALEPARSALAQAIARLPEAGVELATGWAPIRARPVARLGLAYEEVAPGGRPLPDGIYSLRHANASPGGFAAVSATVDLAGGEVAVLT